MEEPSPMGIQTIEMNKLYKYFGMTQNRKIAHPEIKQNLQQQQKGVNIYTIPVITYSFGIVKWTQTDLRNLQKAIRMLMTQYIHYTSR